MAGWKKIIHSGSNAHLNQITGSSLLITGDHTNYPAGGNVHILSAQPDPVYGANAAILIGGDLAGNKTSISSPVNSFYEAGNPSCGVVFDPGTEPNILIGNSDNNLSVSIRDLEQVISIKGSNFRFQPNDGTVNLLNCTSSRVDIAGDLIVSGNIVAQEYIISSSVMHMTTSFSSGSTAFGDTSDDTHIFTGNVGIGTDTPDVELEVVGDILADGLYFSNTVNQTAYIKQTNATGNQIKIGSDNLISFTETDNDIERVRFDLNSGKVGIGTDPVGSNALLTVAGHISSSAKLFAGLATAPSHTDNIVAVVYDTASGEFYYTGSYGGSNTTGFNAVGTGLDITDDLVTIELDLTEVTANGSTANAVLTNDGDGTYTAETTLIYNGTAFTSNVSFNADINANGNIVGDGSANLTGIYGAQLGHITSTQDGAFQNRIDFASDKTSFNDGGHNIDFQVNGDNINNLLFVDAGNDRVGIGTGVPDKTFDVKFSRADTSVNGDGLSGGAAGKGILIENTDTTSGVYANLDFRAHFADARIAVKDVSDKADMHFVLDTNTPLLTRMILQNDGDLHVDSDIIAFSSTTSDRRLKTNIQLLTGSLETICKLEGVRYDWKHRSETNQLGVIAQQVETHVPEVIHETTLPFYAPTKDDDTKYKTVRYEMLVPHLIESIKELKLEIDALKLRLGE